MDSVLIFSFRPVEGPKTLFKFETDQFDKKPCLATFTLWAIGTAEWIWKFAFFTKFDHGWFTITWNFPNGSFSILRSIGNTLCIFTAISLDLILNFISRAISATSWMWICWATGWIAAFTRRVSNVSFFATTSRRYIITWTEFLIWVFKLVFS